MPTPEQITESLTTIANHSTPLAFAWHLAFATAILFVAAGWRPGRQTAALLLTLPCWSVAAVAWHYGNPFNFAMVGTVGLALTMIAMRLSRQEPTRASHFNQFAGVALIAFGLVYPHFLHAASWLAYAYESPFGLIPCPTLAVIAGTSLLANGFGRRAWMLCIALAAGFYGAFGVAVLGVEIDAALLAAVLPVGVMAWRAPAGTFPDRTGDFSHAR